jgi:hypothetical protein
MLNTNGWREGQGWNRKKKRLHVPLKVDVEFTGRDWFVWLDVFFVETCFSRRENPFGISIEGYSFLMCFNVQIRWLNFRKNEQ